MTTSSWLSGQRLGSRSRLRAVRAGRRSATGARRWRKPGRSRPATPTRQSSGWLDAPKSISCAGTRFELLPGDRSRTSRYPTRHPIAKPASQDARGTTLSPYFRSIGSNCQEAGSAVVRYAYLNEGWIPTADQKAILTRTPPNKASRASVVAPGWVITCTSGVTTHHGVTLMA